jgi:hypothetical protein
LQTFAYFGVVYILNRSFDDYATVFDLYDYRMQLDPLIPTFLPANLFVIPMGLSIIYQRYERWSSFIVSIAIFSAFIAYAALPLARITHIYLIKSWSAHLSFICLITIAVIAKLVIDKAKMLSEKYRYNY